MAGGPHRNVPEHHAHDPRRFRACAWATPPDMEKMADSSTSSATTSPTPTRPGPAAPADEWRARHEGRDLVPPRGRRRRGPRRRGHRRSLRRARPSRSRTRNDEPDMGPPIRPCRVRLPGPATPARRRRRRGRRADGGHSRGLIGEGCAPPAAPPTRGGRLAPLPKEAAAASAPEPEAPDVPGGRRPQTSPRGAPSTSGRPAVAHLTQPKPDPWAEASPPLVTPPTVVQRGDSKPEGGTSGTHSDRPAQRRRAVRGHARRAPRTSRSYRLRRPTRSRTSSLDYAKGQARATQSIEAADQGGRLSGSSPRSFFKNEQIDGINRLNLAPSRATATPLNRSKYYNLKAAGRRARQAVRELGRLPRRDVGGGRTPRKRSPAPRRDQERSRTRSAAPVPRSTADSSSPSPSAARAAERSRWRRASSAPAPASCPWKRSWCRTRPIDSTSNAPTSVHGGAHRLLDRGGRHPHRQRPPVSAASSSLAKKLTLYSEIPNELFQDKPHLRWSSSCPCPTRRRSLWFEDNAFIDGTGVGQPLGFLNAPSAVRRRQGDQPACRRRSCGRTSSRRTHACCPARPPGACGSRTSTPCPQLLMMALSVGTGGSARCGSAVTRRRRRGPARPDPRAARSSSPRRCPALARPGDINFVDLGYYLVGDRQAMQMSMLDRSSSSATTTPRCRSSSASTAPPWIKSAITPRKGSNTLSPFVKVATRS